LNKKYSFILAFIITLTFFLNYYYITERLSTEIHTVKRVIDGDTLIIDDDRNIRLVNINSPEKSSNLYNLSREYLSKYENKSLKFRFLKEDKYNRTLARVYSPDYLNLKLVELGLASKFLVQPNELNLFADAEDKAIKNNLGIWKKSIYYGCFNIDIKPKDELIILENLCNKSLSGFYIKDESRKILNLNISQNILFVYSNIGKGNETQIYWGSKESIWNNDRDTLYLFDDNDQLAAHFSYGY
jgi:endonuclease YncB( thermonuclease family)